MFPLKLISFFVLGLFVFHSGAISRSCLQCMCNLESYGCKNIGCNMDAGSLSCGYYQIKIEYYKDCGQPWKRMGESTTSAWKRCANDRNCAEECVRNYMDRYAARCRSNPGCEVFARVHNGGPNGCRLSSTVGYWNKISSCMSR